MRVAKALTLIAAALIWLVVAVAILFLTFPLWGMSTHAPLPSWLLVAFALWLASYVALAITVIRLKKFP